MDRLKSLFKSKAGRILNVYITAGYPELNDTVEIVQALDKEGADIIELGMPYSDPLADGETIQLSSAQALRNGMNLALLFDQVKEIRAHSDIPIILMGYLNQMMQYGVENFLQKCQSNGVDGLIIPDLPMDIYEKKYMHLLEKYNLGFSFLVTPQTTDDRILKADVLSTAFLYVVSQASITGGSSNIQSSQIAYFERLKKLNLQSPRLIGFGIHDRKTFEKACEYGQGAIIGSAFIRAMGKGKAIGTSVKEFVNGII